MANLENKIICQLVAWITQQTPRSSIKYKEEIVLGSLLSSRPRCPKYAGLDIKIFSEEDCCHPGNLMLWVIFSYQCGVIKKKVTWEPLLVYCLGQAPILLGLLLHYRFVSLPVKYDK